jgi:STE24 endopeptidase
MQVSRRIKARPDDYFSTEQISRSKAYNRPLSRLGLTSSVLGTALLVTVVGFKVAPRFIDSLGVESWPLQLIALVSALVVGGLVVQLPFSAYRTFGHEKKWGFSTQTPPLWISDQVKGLLLGLIIANALSLVLWWVIRTTDLWWLLGALIFTAFGVLLAAIAPVVIIPLFNKLTPVDDDGLRQHLKDLAKEGGLRVKDVLVMDASKRTRHDNAFFTGMGKTKRVVIFDNMVDWDRGLIDVVVGHEVGHWRHRHIVRSIAIGTITAFVVFVGLRFVFEWDALLGWAGVDSVRSPAAIPLFILAFGVLSIATNFVDSWVSRMHERQADLFALNLTKTPDAFLKVWREFSEKDLADLTPSWWKRVNGSHPPVFERIAFGENWKRTAC